MSKARIRSGYELTALRTWLGLVAASLTGSITGSVILWLNMNITGQHTYLTGPYIADPLFALTVGVVAGGLFGIPAAFALGWPLHVVLQCRKITGLTVYLAVGSALAVMTNVPFVISAGRDLPFGDGVTLIACLVTGAIAGLVFWLIRRPDRMKPRHAGPAQ